MINWINNEIYCSADDLKFKYGPNEPNEEVTLYDDLIEFEHDEKKYRCNGRVFVKWFPTKLMQVQINYSGRIEIDSGKVLTIKLTKISVDIAVEIVDVELQRNVEDGSYSVEILGIVPSLIEFGSAENILRIESQLLNFNKQGINLIITKGNSLGPKAGIILSGGGWDVFILGDRKKRERLDKLKKYGGYLNTDKIHIQRSNKKAFTIDEGKSIVRKITPLLNFINGGFTQLFVIEGVGDGGRWTLWNSNCPQSEWHDTKTWYPRWGHALDNSMFENYMKLIKEPTWFETIKKAIEYYVRAQRADFEGRYIWVTLGLEVLAWGHLEVGNIKMSKIDFDGKDLQFRIQKLLNQSKIDYKIPSIFLPDLRRICKKDKNNGAQLLATIRNEIAHPQKDKRILDKLDSERLREISQLGLWYLELSILYLLDYNGQYNHRFFGGLPGNRTKKMPWAKE